jgi:hypothetical protein
MSYAAMFAVLAMFGAGAGGAVVMAGDDGHGSPDDVQAQSRWTGPAGFGNCTGPGDGSGHQYGYGELRMADDDGDGIPNGQDDDWVPPEDGSGYQYRHRP